ncbi:MAG TPA: DUF4838 domain-containing protein [Chthonomonadales bacterium]|nr:DUF4838 domain-containing protein [Chthonomonadales bacterium]
MHTGHRLLAFALAAAAMPLSLAADAQRITLARNGRTDYVILVAPGASPSMRRGADELRRHLREITGADFPVSEGDPIARPTSASRRSIFVGDAELYAQRQLGERLGDEEFHLRTSGQRIEIYGGRLRGAMYGCYAFLEQVLGCRWFTATIARIPRQPTLVIGPLDMREKPAFVYREPYWTEALDGDWAARNRTNGSSQRLGPNEGGRVVYGRFVHTFAELVPPAQHFATNPEFFPLIDGMRRDGYHQLCLTNPDVLRIATEGVRRWIRENPEATIFSVSQNDTGGWCECEACRAIVEEEGAPSGLLLRFVNAVAEAVEGERPGVLIDTLAYQATEAPPRTVRPRANVRVRFAPIGVCVAHPLETCPENAAALENLRAWSRITSQLAVWHYATNFACYLQPLPNLDSIPADLELFRRLGVTGVFFQGGYAPGGGAAMAELKAYLMAQLMWNPARPATPIVQEFLDGVYGRAAPYMRRWIDLLHRPVRQDGVHARIYDPPTAAYLSEDFVREGERLLDAAARAVSEDVVALEQVARVRLWLDTVRLLQFDPRYVVEEGVYAPAAGAARAELARTVAAAIRRIGVTQVREGEPVERFLERIERPLPSYPVLTIENDALRVDVVPVLGGRLLRLIDRQSGFNLMHGGGVGPDGMPRPGGFEEYTGSAFRSPGWSEPYTGSVLRGADAPGGRGAAIRVSVTLANGLALERTYLLDGAALHIDTLARNDGAQPVEVTIRSHPEFAAPQERAPRVTFRDGAGRDVETILTHHETDVFLGGTSTPAGEWTLHVGDLRLTERFERAQVSQALLNGTLTVGRVNLELYGVTRRLAPGETTRLQRSWTVERAPATPVQAGSGPTDDAPAP